MKMIAERLCGANVAYNSSMSLSCCSSSSTSTKTNTNRVIGMCMPSKAKSKKANLCATRKERVKLPSCCEEKFGIAQFLTHPCGIESVLNTRALQNFQFLDPQSNIYRCTLPTLELLNFQASPVLDLRVNPTPSHCTVELLSCKFKGSEVVESQNQHFSAFMVNQMSWDTDDSDPYLEVDVKLNLSLEIYTQPFTLLPTSAVERPGNIMMQALVDRLVPLLLQQLLQDYEKWVDQQRRSILT